MLRLMGIQKLHCMDGADYQIKVLFILIPFGGVISEF